MPYTRPSTINTDASWVGTGIYIRPDSINADATWLTSTLLYARSVSPLTATGHAVITYSVTIRAGATSPLQPSTALFARAPWIQAQSSSPLATGLAVLVSPATTRALSASPLQVGVTLLANVLRLYIQSSSPLRFGLALIRHLPPGVRAQSLTPLVAGQAHGRTGAILRASSISPLVAGQAILYRTVYTAIVARIQLFAAILAVNRLRSRLLLPSGSASADLLAAHLVLPSGRPLGAHLLLPAASTAPLAARVGLPAALTDSDRLSVRLVLLASLLDGTVQVMAPLPVLRHGTRTLSPLAVTLSADLGSPVWQADITLADSAEYAPIRLGDALEIAIGTATWFLLCDTKQRTRPSGYTIKALSAGARLGAPWARPRALGEVDLARAVCERLLGSEILWDLPDWKLPNSASSLTGTPLSLARQIVATVGGVLEARPDGLWSARPQCPLSPPTASGPVQAILTDATLFAHAEQAGTPEIANRYTITSGDSTVGTLPVQIEVVPDDSDSTHRTVRAYPSPWLDLQLVHTGDATVTIGPRAEVHLAKTDFLAIVAGEASTSFPVETITSTSYRYIDLGTVTVTGKALKTANAEYSQMALAYTAHAWQWEVYHPRIETIQFLAIGTT